jgi:hypothetical protein
MKKKKFIATTIKKYLNENQDYNFKKKYITDVIQLISDYDDDDDDIYVIIAKHNDIGEIARATFSYSKKLNGWYSDFWYTRNGHGVGFLDRQEEYGEELANKLNDIAKSFPPKNNVFVQNGEWYIE